MVEVDCMIHCAVTGMRFPSLAPPSSTQSSSSLLLVADAASALGSSASAVAASDAAGKTVNDVQVTEPNSKSEVKGSSLTPVKSNTHRPLPATPQSDVHHSSNNNFAFATPNKSTAKRYVPVVSPSSTIMQTPPPPTPPPAVGSINRMSIRLNTWRNSITSSFSSPVPFVEKMSSGLNMANIQGSSMLNSLTSAVYGTGNEESAKDFHAGNGASVSGDEDEKSTKVGIDFDTAADDCATVTNSESESSSSSSYSVDRDSHNSQQSTTASETSEAHSNAEKSIVEALQTRSEQVDASEVLTPEMDPLIDSVKWVNSYAKHVTANYTAALQGMSFILLLYAQNKKLDDNQDFSGDVSRGSQAEHGEALQVQYKSLFENNLRDIMAEIDCCVDVHERIAILKEKVDLCNTQVTLHWSMLMTALRIIMPKLNSVLKMRYFVAARLFWRGQFLIYTKR